MRHFNDSSRNLLQLIANWNASVSQSVSHCCEAIDTRFKNSNVNIQTLDLSCNIKESEIYAGSQIWENEPIVFIVCLFVFVVVFQLFCLSHSLLVSFSIADLKSGLQKSK